MSNRSGLMTKATTPCLSAIATAVGGGRSSGIWAQFRSTPSRPWRSSTGRTTTQLEAPNGLVKLAAAAIRAEQGDELWETRWVVPAHSRERLSPREISERGILLVHG